MNDPAETGDLAILPDRTLLPDRILLTLLAGFHGREQAHVVALHSAGTRGGFIVNGRRHGDRAAALEASDDPRP